MARVSAHSPAEAGLIDRAAAQRQRCRATLRQTSKRRPGAARLTIDVGDDALKQLSHDAISAVPALIQRPRRNGHTHQPAWWQPTADGRVVDRRVPTDIAVEAAAGSLLNPGAACDPAGVRWLALELGETGGAPFAVTFHLEPAPR
jgi:hypothetical protein